MGKGSGNGEAPSASGAGESGASAATPESSKPPAGGGNASSSGAGGASSGFGEVQVTVVFPPTEPAAEAAVKAAAGGQEPVLQLALPAAPGAAAAASATLSEVRGLVGPLVGGLDQLEQGVADLVKRMSQAGDHLVALRHQFVDKINKNESQERAFNKLYEEMGRYRDNFLLAAEKPLFMALILLYDNICRAAKALKENAQGREALENLKAELLEVLSRHDVELIDDRPEKLDISFQKAIRREETNDPAEDLRVAEVVRDGFRWHERVMRPQEVVVKRRLASQ